MPVVDLYKFLSICLNQTPNVIVLLHVVGARYENWLQIDATVESFEDLNEACNAHRDLIIFELHYG